MTIEVTEDITSSEKVIQEKRKKKPYCELLDEYGVRDPCNLKSSAVRERYAWLYFTTTKKTFTMWLTEWLKKQGFSDVIEIKPGSRLAFYNAMAMVWDQLQEGEQER